MLRTRLLVVAAWLAAAPLGAQRDPRIEVTLPPAGALGTEAPSVRCLNIFADNRLRELLEHGFPARLHQRLELWSASGWFNDLKQRTEWDLIVRFNPLDRQYTVVRFVGDDEPGTLLGTFKQLSELEDALARPFQPPLRPPTRHERYYYNASLDVDMLSVNDLDEVQRWLRGEFRPAVRGERNPGTALGRGVQELVVKLLGGAQRHYESRTSKFTPE